MRSLQRAAVALALSFLSVFLLAGPLLVVDDGPHHADAIVVVGGDHKPERIRRALELYEGGYAPIVIVSAGRVVLEGGERLPEAEVMRRQALGLGLPEAVLLVEDQSLSTYQNAYYTRAICRERAIRSVLLVTSAHQSRRARLIFREVYGSEISLSVRPAHLPRAAFWWWLDPDQAPVVLYEYYNWVRYWLGIRLPAESAPALG